MNDVPRPDDPGKYDRVFFRIGGGISTLGIAVVSFFFYEGIHSPRSLAQIAGVTDLRLEGTIVGITIVLVGLLIAMGGPVLYCEIS